MPITLKREWTSVVHASFPTEYAMLRLPKPTPFYHVVGAPDLFGLKLVLRRNFDHTTRRELPQDGWRLRVPGFHFVQSRHAQVPGTEDLCRYSSLNRARLRFNNFTDEEWETLYFLCLLRIALGPDRDKLTDTQLAAAHVASMTIPHERRT